MHRHALGLALVLFATAPISAQGHSARVERPMVFEPNEGQAPGAVRYLSRGEGYGVFVLADAIELALCGKDQSSLQCLALRLLGSAAGPARGERALASRTHYLRGRDPSRWRTDVPGYARVRLPGAWPGIDLVARGAGRRLEYDFELAPGADPRRIRFAFEGATHASLAADGSLRLATPQGDIVQRPPVAWQDAGDERRPVTARFAAHDDGSFGFALGDYDASQALTIDPVVTYASYLGGSEADAIWDLAVDAQGNAYVCGHTVAADFPVKNALRGQLTGTYDAFAAKVNADGSLAWSTYLGGTGSYQDYEYAQAIAVDAAGQAIVTGRTSAPDFPVVNAAQPALGGGYDAFVAKLSATGSSLVWSTYLGGAGFENTDKRLTNATYGGDVAVDAAGSVWVAGATDSPDFPTKSPLQATLAGPRDAFLVKLAPAGTIAFATYFGGQGDDTGQVVRADGQGAVYLAGGTGSADFPTTQGAFLEKGGSGFVAKLGGAAPAVVWSTRMATPAQGLAIDGQGAVYLCGSLGMSSGCFPTVFGALQTAHSGRTYHTLAGLDAWWSKLDPSGQRLLWSTLWGIASSDEVASDVVIDATGHPIVALWGRVAKLDPEGRSFLYQHQIPGSSVSRVALAPGGRIWAAGTTSSTTLPVTGNAFQPQPGGRGDGFLVRLDDSASTLQGVLVRSPKLARGQSMWGLVTLDGRNAGPQPIAVSLAAAPAGVVSIPSTVSVLPGDSSARFQVQTTTSAPISDVTITAMWGTASQSAKLRVWLGPSYRAVYLGNLGGSDFKTSVYGLNDTGEATGTSRTPSIGFDVFLHSDAAGLQGLGAGTGVAINATGQIAGASGRSAFLWTKGTGFRTLGGSVWHEATGLNDRGEVCGWSSNLSTLGFFWSAARGWVDLPHLGGGASSANGINNRGEVVGQSTIAGVWYAFLWSQTGGMKSLGLLPGHFTSTAYGINDLSEVVGISSPTGYTAPRAFLWRGTTGMKDLGVLAGDEHSLAFAVNEHTHAAGFSAKRGAIGKRAIVWSEAQGMRELTDLVDPEASFGWTLEEARALNDLGQLAGNGVWRDKLLCGPSAWRLDPVGYAPYGRGCPGSAGVPALAGEGDPAPGGTTHLLLAKGKPQAPAVLMLGTARGALPLPGGCTWLAGGAVVHGATLLLDPDGRLRLPLPLPVSLAPFSVVLQAFVLDAASGNGLFAASNGIEMSVR